MSASSAGGFAPCTVVDRQILQRNVELAARSAADAGVALRPHAKTHKSLDIASLQLRAGAVGLSVATVGEAEILADAAPGGRPGDLFIALPVWPGDDAAARLRQLCEWAVITVGADSVAGIDRLAAAVPATCGLRVAVELDCGLGRTGTGADAAAGVASAAVDAGYEVVGVFTFPGHSYRPGAAVTAADDECSALAKGRAALESAGIACPVRSGGSTPSLADSLRLAGAGVVTELRPGVYVLNDAQQVALGTVGVDQVALWVLSRVVSAVARDRIVLDAGSKLLGPDRPPWVPGHGLLPDHPGAVVTGLWEHHAVVDVSACRYGRPSVGEVVRIVPNHVCSAVNLVDELLVVDGDETVVDRWAVSARGLNG